MEDLNVTVAAILEIFGGGITAIKKLRKSRKDSKTRVDSGTKAAETSLGKSLKRSKTDIRSVYKKDVEKLGVRFKVGDVSTRNILTRILERLKLGFQAMKQKLLRGQSSSKDYQALLGLSNSSRQDILTAFSDLSSRLSRSSLSVELVQMRPKVEKRPAAKLRSPSSSKGRAMRPQGARRTKSAPELSAKKGAKSTSDTTTQVRPKMKKSKSETSTKAKITSRPTSPQNKPKKSRQQTEDQVSDETVRPNVLTRVNRRASARLSIMSFATDSTKLGEIPQRKWAVPIKDGETEYPIMAVYPLEPWKDPQESEKSRWRLKNLFRR